MALRRKFSRRRKETGEFGLLITSLADILIIVLVFLLKSYSTDSVPDVPVPSEILLPEVTSGGAAKEGLTVHIYQDKVEVNGEQVVQLTDFKFPAVDLRGDLSNNNGTSTSLRNALNNARKTLAKLEDGKEDNSMWIIAHNRAPYATIQTVLASGALKGFTDFKLAVIKEN